MGVSFIGTRKDRFETLKREHTPSLAAGCAGERELDDYTHGESFPRLPDREDSKK